MKKPALRGHVLSWKSYYLDDVDTQGTGSVFHCVQKATKTNFFSKKIKDVVPTIASITKKLMTDPKIYCAGVPTLFRFWQLLIRK